MKDERLSHLGYKHIGLVQGPNSPYRSRCTPAHQMSETNSNAPSTKAPNAPEWAVAAPEAWSILIRLGRRVLSAGSNAVEIDWKLGKDEKDMLDGWLLSYNGAIHTWETQGKEFLTISIIELHHRLVKTSKWMVENLKTVLCEEDSAPARRQALPNVFDLKLEINDLLKKKQQHWQDVIEAAPKAGPELWAVYNLTAYGNAMDVGNKLTLFPIYDWARTSPDSTILERVVEAAGFTKWSGMSPEDTQALSTIFSLEQKAEEMYRVWSKGGFADQDTIMTDGRTLECTMQ